MECINQVYWPEALGADGQLMHDWHGMAWHADFHLNSLLAGAILATWIGTGSLSAQKTSQSSCYRGPLSVLVDSNVMHSNLYFVIKHWMKE